MTNQTISELLIVFLCIVSSGRVFFKVRKDGTSVLPFINFIIAILNVLSWGINLTELLLLALTFWVAFWNIRSLLKFASDLRVDSFTLPFILISVFNLILSVVLGTFIFIYRPVAPDKDKFNTRETISYYYKDANGRYQVETNPFGSKDIKIYRYENTTEQANRKIIIFLPSKYNRINAYTPFYYKLSHDGYTVYTGEIYGENNRWFKGKSDSHLLRTSSFESLHDYDPKEYEHFINAGKTQYKKEYETILKISAPKEGDAVFLCCDGEVPDILSDLDRKSVV